MRKITEIEYQMGEKEFKEKLGLDGELKFIIIKTLFKENSANRVITITTKSLRVEK